MFYRDPDVSDHLICVETDHTDDLQTLRTVIESADPDGDVSCPTAADWAKSFISHLGIEGYVSNSTDQLMIGREITRYKGKGPPTEKTIFDVLDASENLAKEADLDQLMRMIVFLERRRTMTVRCRLNEATLADLEEWRKLSASNGGVRTEV